MTTKLHKAYSKNKNAFYYFKCDCLNIFIARNDANPKSCGCLMGKPKSVDIETNINQIETTPKTHKNCWKCKTVLPLDKFNKGTSCCKDCFREYKKGYRQRNKDEIAQYSREYKLKQLGLTAEQYQELKESRLNKIKENKEKSLKRKQKAEELRQQLELKKLSPTKECIKCGEIKPKSEFHKAKGKIDGYDNRCKVCEKLRLRRERGWQPRVAVSEEEKRIRRSLNKHIRRTRERNAGPLPKPKDIIELKKKQKNRCYWCYTDISVKYEKDHYIPICKGGDSSLHNFVLTCPKCNGSKNGRDPIEFANKLGRLL